MARQDLTVAGLNPEWELHDIKTTLFKCTRWQFEDTLDPFNCPFHYFCDSIFPGTYPPGIDFLFYSFTAASYLTTLAIMLLDFTKTRQLNQSKRYLLPSGPVALPLILLGLAKGQRINAVFPLHCIAPAVLQLVQISALAFDNGPDKSLKNAIFEASTISGVLHASMYLDSVILPFYTGFDALVSSRFSGECPSCICRKDALVVGGKLNLYQGWSLTTFSVVVALCFRMACRLSGDRRWRIWACKPIVESLGWVLITKDCIFLLLKSPPEQPLAQAVSFGAMIVLICLHFLKTLLAGLAHLKQKDGKELDL